MALNDKNILITPSIGSSTADPKIDFVGASTNTGPSTITAVVYPTNNGTVSFIGTEGTLFSITNNLSSGSIFSVNPISGIPIIDVNADRTIALNPFGGNTGIGTTNPLSKLDVRGDITLGTSGINTISSVVNDIVAWEYSGISTSVTTQDTFPEDIYFKNDGTKMFIVGSTNDRVYEYALSTAWNVSTAGFTTFFSVASQDTDPKGLYFKPDGTEMYVSGVTGVAGAGLVAAGDYVHQYTLSTPWSIAAGSVGYTTSFRILEDASPFGCFISTDGTKLYVAGATNDRVYQYTLSTPWSLAAGNVSFASSISVTTQDTNITGIDFNSTGSIMWLSGSTNDRIYQYNLSTPWTLSSAVFYDSVYVGHQESAPNGVYVEPSQNKAYVVGNNSDTVYQYNTNIPAIDIKSSGISTTSAIVLRNDVRALDNMSVRGRFTANGVANFNNNVQVDSTLSNSGTLSHTGTSASLNNTATVTNSTTLNLSTYASSSGVQKTINVGTGGAAGSRLLVAVGSTTVGTASTVVFNSGTDVLIGASTTTGTTSQPLQVTGGAYVSGSVGIGTTNPTQELDVNGDLRLRAGLYDFNNVVGAAGSILSSTGVGVSWITPAFQVSSIGILTTGSNATYTAPTNLKYAIVIATGGGGGGGGSDTDGSAGGGGAGGAAGATAIRVYSSTELGATATYTIGANGTGGNNTGTNGTAGGNTTFIPVGTGTSLTANGGSLGTGSGTVATNSTVAGSAGGTATGGQINIEGGDGGGAGGTDAGGIGVGGFGGSSFWGGGGANGVAGVSAGSAGLTGAGYGSGGGGSGTGDNATGAAGGDGKSGVIFVLEFTS